jgi:hypothetical protein
MGERLLSAFSGAGIPVSVRLFARLSVCLHPRPSCLTGASIRLCLGLSACLSICLSVRLSNWLAPFAGHAAAATSADRVCGAFAIGRMASAQSRSSSGASEVFQQRLQEALEREPQLLDAFLNRLYNMLNWTATEFIVALKARVSPSGGLACPRRPCAFDCSGSLAAPLQGFRAGAQGRQTDARIPGWCARQTDRRKDAGLVRKADRQTDHLVLVCGCPVEGWRARAFTRLCWLRFAGGARRPPPLARAGAAQPAALHPHV